MQTVVYYKNNQESNTKFAGLATAVTWIKQQKLFCFMNHIGLPMKTVKRTPRSKMEDLVVGIMSGVKCIRDINETTHRDKGLAKVLGRSSLADQSLLSEMLNKFDERSVEKLRSGVVNTNKNKSQALKDLRRGYRVMIDIDMTDLPCSKKCEGAKKGYTTSRKGTPVRQVSLIYASKHQELLDIHLHAGNTHCTDPLKKEIEAFEHQYGISKKQRGKITLRVDSGYGSDGNITWLCKRGYRVVAKGYSSRRAAAIVRSLKPNRRWIKVSSDQYVLKVKQIKTIGVSHEAVLVKTKSKKPKEDKWVYSLLITNLKNKGPVSLVKLYNQRQAIEKEIQQVKSVLGLKHKRKKSFQGMAALALFTLMANNILVWFKKTLPKSVHYLGLKRLIHEILSIPGSISGFAKGFKVAIESQYAFSKILLSLSKQQKPLPLGF